MLLSQTANRRKISSFLPSRGFLLLCFLAVLIPSEKKLFASQNPVLSEDLSAPQYLPLEAEWCLPQSSCLGLEVADTDFEKRLGLMKRPPLAKWSGMLFQFDPPQIVRFWMYNTYHPVDMVFCYEHAVVAVLTNVPTCSRLPCPGYGPGLVIDNVIELSAGSVERLKIQVGDEVDLRFINLSKQI